MSKKQGFNEPRFTQAALRDLEESKGRRPLDDWVDDVRTTEQEPKVDAVILACDSLGFATRAVRQWGMNYWTDDQNFAATMEVYRGILQCHMGLQNNDTEEDR